jgi:LPXTG-motif cell wall-anchored protein
VIAAAVAVALAATPVGARRPTAEPPPGCRPYSDAGDYACAGIELAFHTSGSGAATSTIWAGQWLFTDDAGNYRLGSCTFNRGLHPRADDPARPIAQSLPNDPGHDKSAYLTWRYGSTTDDLTAAALWAIFHYYAQDPAGSARAADPTSSLVPSLEMVGQASGRADLQQRAIALDAEAARYAGKFRMSADVAGTTVTIRVAVDKVGVPGVAVDVDGTVLVTDDAGAVTVQAVPGSTVRASASIPGEPVVYLAAPLRPHQFGGQSLITAGPPSRNETGATVPLPATTTTTLPPPTTAAATTTSTTSTTSTTTPPATTTPATTATPTTTTRAPSTTSSTTSTSTPTTTTASTTIPPSTATSTVPPTDAATTSTAPAVSSSTSIVDVAPPPVPSPPPAPPPSTLPETGTTQTVAGAAALVLGAGVGALVGLRRRLRPAAAAPDDIWA